MIVNVEDKEGNDIGQVWVKENINGGLDVLKVVGGLSVADVEGDVYFDSDDLVLSLLFLKV